MVTPVAGPQRAHVRRHAAAPRCASDASSSWGDVRPAGASSLSLRRPVRTARHTTQKPAVAVATLATASAKRRGVVVVPSSSSSSTAFARPTRRGMGVTASSAAANGAGDVILPHGAAHSRVCKVRRVATSVFGRRRYLPAAQEGGVGAVPGYHGVKEVRSRFPRASTTVCAAAAGSKEPGSSASDGRWSSVVNSLATVMEPSMVESLLDEVRRPSPPPMI